MAQVKVVLKKAQLCVRTPAGEPSATATPEPDARWTSVETALPSGSLGSERSPPTVAAGDFHCVYVRTSQTTKYTLYDASIDFQRGKDDLKGR